MKTNELLFTKMDIDNIVEKINTNFDILLKNDDYNSISNELVELRLSISTHFNKEQIKILNNYAYLLRECDVYEHALAYYLGMKSIQQINTLK